MTHLLRHIFFVIIFSLETVYSLISASGSSRVALNEAHQGRKAFNILSFNESYRSENVSELCKQQVVQLQEGFRRGAQWSNEGKPSSLVYRVSAQL